MNTRKFLLGVFVLVVLILYSGCTHRTSHLQGSYLSPVAQINPEYEVLSDVTGIGSSSYVGFYPIPFSVLTVSDGRNLLFGFKPYSKAKAAAFKQALAQNPNADTIIIYKIEEEEEKVLWWFKKSTVTVKAKAVKIK
ncbi:MAG TPA: hypothetical protein ENN73_01060 [Firmicutes bacterium]|nr:hypothetical protein [Bacillota bacterium]